jgi:hypothetical protein
MREFLSDLKSAGQIQNLRLGGKETPSFNRDLSRGREKSGSGIREMKKPIPAYVT